MSGKENVTVITLLSIVFIFTFLFAPNAFINIVNWIYVFFNSLFDSFLDWILGSF